MAQLTAIDSSGLIQELIRNDYSSKLSRSLEVTEDTLGSWAENSTQPSPLVEQKLAYFCFENQLHDLFIQYDGVPPVYDHLHDTEKFSFAVPPLGVNIKIEDGTQLKNRPTKIGGLRVNFPFGVPASTHTRNSEWLGLYGRLGFDILTYKTVRTVEREAHPTPRLTFVPNPIMNGSEQAEVADLHAWPEDPSKVTMANSFGIPSQPIDLWQADVFKAKTQLRSSQILIVSVIGSTKPTDDSFSALVKDFVKVSQIAKDAGADIIELNLSCPNLRNPQKGDLYRNPIEAYEVTKAVYDALGKGSTPLFIKISYLNNELLTELTQKIAGYVNGIVAINAVNRRVYDKRGKPFFQSEKANRASCGLSGSAIKPMAQEVVRNLAELKLKYRYDYDILAVGGVTTPKDFQDYLDIGANGVQSCTGAWLNPQLAIDTRIIPTQVQNRSNVTILDSKPSMSPEKTPKNEKDFSPTAKERKHPALEILDQFRESKSISERSANVDALIELSKRQRQRKAQKQKIK